MVDDTGLTAAQFLIAPTLDRYGRSRGWDPRSFAIFYRTNPDVGRIHVLIVAEALNDQDEYQAVRDVWDYLRQELRDEPDVLKSINLDVRSQKKADEGGLYAVAPSYHKYWRLPQFTNDKP
ncbi:hypothetical protein [Paludisphaera mucosa]|uniref:Uncharacterized protein n=1 Tax=Paludisphaera mucosa TaxID=3030827 RepID=A0ABT6F532_9BACT|nr:hypothetical protein [Paludisphaera mucosa]MDG3002697.1 hypothetical protein [Paludisphaera mucosa]